MHGLQAELLTLTLEHLAVGLNNPTPTAIMHALQTEVLLASYFFSNNCALEGTYRANAAADMALACRLHVIGSLCGPTSDVLPISIPYRLAVPANVVEMGECINAFWTVYALDKAWSFALGYASAFTDDERKGTEIDVPWPLTVHDNMPASLRTVKVFVYGASPAHAQESWLALHAKAISLMEHATRTASLISGGTGSVPAEASQLDQRIEQFKGGLQEIPPMNTSRADLIPRLLMIHIIAHCATIELFQRRDSQGGRVDTESKTARAVTSAVWLLRQIDYSRIKHVDAFLGVRICVH